MFSLRPAVANAITTKTAALNGSKSNVKLFDKVSFAVLNPKPVWLSCLLECCIFSRWLFSLIWKMYISLGVWKQDLTRSHKSKYSIYSSCVNLLALQAVSGQRNAWGGGICAEMLCLLGWPDWGKTMLLRKRSILKRGQVPQPVEQLQGVTQDNCRCM